jgi:hypothetical protein
MRRAKVVVAIRSPWMWSPAALRGRKEMARSWSQRAHAFALGRVERVSRTPRLPGCDGAGPGSFGGARTLRASDGYPTEPREITDAASLRQIFS